MIVEIQKKKQGVSRAHPCAGCSKIQFRKIVLSLFVLLFSLYSSLQAANIKIEATIDKTRVGLNKTFTLTITLAGDGVGQVSLEPEFPKSMDKFCKFLGRGGESSNFQLINGRMSVSKSVQYNFLARAIGKFKIEPITFQAGGKTYQTKTIQLEITKAASSQSRSPSTSNRGQRAIQAENSVDGNLFLKAAVNKKTVYLHEPVIVTYKIYTRVNVTSYSIDKSPNTVGFWEENFELPQQPRLYDEVVNGKRFKVAEIKKVALFPTEIGKKLLDPLVINCDVRVQSRRRSRDFFDNFFDDPFFGRSQRYKIVAAPALTINVLPLPTENRPRNFSGAVGKYTLTAKVDKREVETNESIKFKVRLTGQGNIKILPNPLVTIPPEFEQYGPTSSEKISREDDKIQGSKTFEYVLIPRVAGKKTIQPIEFAYFDLQAKSYKILKTSPIHITTRKGKKGAMAVGTGFTRKEIAILGQDIRYIQQTIPEFTLIGRYFYQSYSFLILFLLPIFVLIGALVYQQRLNKFSGNVAYARFKRANRIATERLKQAKKHMSIETQKKFYAEISKALLSFLANKLNLDEAGIMMDQVQSLLQERKVPEETIHLYLDCLQICDFQRFAPASATPEEMKNFYTQARSAIANLQKII